MKMGKIKQSANLYLGRTNYVRRIVAIGCVLLVLVALTGCGSLFGINESKSTPTNSPVISTETTTQPLNKTPTATSTPTKTPKRTTREKYSYFQGAYVNSLENKSINVVNNSLDSQNETLYITYEMRDKENDVYTGRERENVSLLYVVGVEVYLNNSKTPNYDKEWIPKQINVTVVTPGGELYETAYTTFERAKKMIGGEISAKRYLLEYYGTIEPGPANPDYEG